MKNVCPNCRKLEGQSGDIAPPAQMRPETQYFVKDGVVEVYRCRPCGSQWERFVPEEPLARSGQWKTLNPLGC